MRVKLASLFLLTAPLILRAQIAPPNGKMSVPVSDNAGFAMDLYKQTHDQRAKIAGMSAEIQAVSESLGHIENWQNGVDTKLTDLRRDVDKQSLIGSLFVFSAQTFSAVVIALVFTIPATFFVQRWLNERFSKPVRDADRSQENH